MSLKRLERGMEGVSVRVALLFYCICAKSNYCSYQVRSYASGRAFSNQDSSLDTQADKSADVWEHMESYTMSHSVATIIESHFHTNNAAVAGGGLFCQNHDTLEISLTVFTHNKAAAGYGGGVYSGVNASSHSSLW